MSKRIKAVTQSVETTSKLLGVHYITCLKMCKDGRLPCLRLGRQFLVLKEPFEKMLRPPSRPAA